VRSEDAEIVEAALCRALPPERWTQASDTLILHGRRICRPRPLCDRCAVRTQCSYYRSLGAAAARRLARAPLPRARKRKAS
jgi:endonuclease-3